ncbi:hypothetical protein [Bacillus sp. Marseille-Q3570]|uniref:hypothetical protein n=1 Tax=Bacillus sp. Marseille-Q3570 TaxID=2963522 RepID=UPI0021B70F0D|nr:hypothetical protein [Bacillus sp. Marseille-Q3570]
MPENDNARQTTGSENNQDLTNMDRMEGKGKNKKDKTHSEKIRYEHADEIYE